MTRRQAHPTRAMVRLVSVVVVFAFASLASNAAAAFPGKNGRIAMGFGGCISTMKPDGTDIRDVACDDRRLSTMPEWSPNGRRILFLGDLGQPTLMAADG